MTDNEDPFASFFEKKDKKVKTKKVKNVVSTDELADRLQRAAVREQKANQTAAQATEGINPTYTTAVDMMDNDEDEFSANSAVVANLGDEDAEQRKFERNISTVSSTNKSNPWGAPAAPDRKNSAAAAVTESDNASTQPSALATPSSVSGSTDVLPPAAEQNASSTIPDSTSENQGAKPAPSGEAGKLLEAEKPKEAQKATQAFVPSRLKQAMEAGTYKPPGFQGESNDVRNFSNDVRVSSGPLSGAPGGAYKPPGQRGESGGGGATAHYRRTAAPNITSQNDFPSL